MAALRGQTLLRDFRGFVGSGFASWRWQVGPGLQVNALRARALHALNVRVCFLKESAVLDDDDS